MRWSLRAALAVTAAVAAILVTGRPHDRAAPKRAPAPAAAPSASPTPAPTPRPARPAPIRWRRSVAVGTHAAGRLVRGVRLAPQRRTYFTWDPVERRQPNRPWRRWGTDRLVRTLLAVAREHRAAHPRAPRMAVGDLSRPRGGDFGARFGPIGHVSHQNGLDADVYYPRRDRRERAPRDVSQIDRRLSQDLVDRFVAKGALVVFVGPNTGLTGPPGRVQPLANHDNHLHVRLPVPASR